MSTPDITILGAGIFGLCTAWSALKRGASVQIIDTRGIGAGASGGIVGALAPHTPDNWNAKKQFQFESLIMAENYWAEIEALTDLPTGYARLGRLQPILNARGLELARARETSARDLWQTRATWQVMDTKNHKDWSPISPTGHVIFDTLSARIHPRLACAALAKAIEMKGGKIIIGKGTRKGKILHATGHEGLKNGLGTGVKGQALLIDFDARDKPQLFADSLHIIPHSDGTTAIGSTSESKFGRGDTTDAQLNDIHARACTAFPMLKGAKILERWAGIRPKATSRAPLLGLHPHHDGHYIANGGFKIGFGMAPKIGEVMADLMLNGKDTIPDAFKPEIASQTQ